MIYGLKFCVTNFFYHLEILGRRIVPSWLAAARWQQLWILPLTGEKKWVSDVRGDLPLEMRIVRNSCESADFGLLASQCGKEMAQMRLASGAFAAVAVEKPAAGGESMGPVLAGVVWFSTGKYLDLDTRLEILLQPSDAWLFGAWVRRDLRGRGLYQCLLNFSVSELGGAMGGAMIDRVWLGTDRSNHLSRLVHQRLGARPAGVCYGVKILGAGRYRCRCDLAVRSAD